MRSDLTLLDCVGMMISWKIIIAGSPIKAPNYWYNYNYQILHCRLAPPQLTETIFCDLFFSDRGLWCLCGMWGLCKWQYVGQPQQRLDNCQVRYITSLPGVGGVPCYGWREAELQVWQMSPPLSSLYLQWSWCWVSWRRCCGCCSSSELVSEEEEELALRCSVLCENSSPEPGRLSCEPADDICLFQTTDVGGGQAGGQTGQEEPECWDDWWQDNFLRTAHWQSWWWSCSRSYHWDRGGEVELWENDSSSQMPDLAHFCLGDRP